MSRRPRRWGCWRWSPARTPGPPRAAMALMGGGGSPARSPRTGWSRSMTPRHGIPASHPGPAGVVTAPPSGPTPCRTCPLRARCTTAQDGRTLRLHPHDAILRAARATWAAQPALRQDYKKYRPNVERVISQVASRGGRRLKLRYLGTAKNNAWLKNRTAALNLRNLIHRGLNHHNGAWVLA